MEMNKGLPYLSEQIVQAEKKLMELKTIVDGILVNAGLSVNGSSHHASLTKQESKILRLVAAGKSIDEVAAALKISKRTVEAHRHNVQRKFGVKFNQLIQMYRPQLKVVA